MPRKLIDYTQRGKKLGLPGSSIEARSSMRSLQPCFEGEQTGRAPRRLSNCSAISDISCDVPSVLDLSFADLGLDNDEHQQRDDNTRAAESRVEFMMKIPSKKRLQKQQEQQISRHSSQKSLREMFSKQRSNKAKKTSIIQSVLGDLLAD